VYTTHYLDEAERLCDRLAIIDHGALLAEGTLFVAGRRLTGLSALGDGQVTVVRPTGRQESTFGRRPGEFFAYVFPGLLIFGLMFISQSLALRLMRIAFKASSVVSPSRRCRPPAATPPLCCSSWRR
jgi:hypothetical protein